MYIYIYILLHSGSYHVISGIAEVYKTPCFLSTRGFCKISVSSKINFGRNTQSVRLVILVGLYHLS